MYQHGKRTKAPRNASVFLAAIIIMGVVVLIAWYIIHKDVGNTTDPKTNVPIITEVGAEEGEKLQIDERLFKMELPVDWKLYEERDETEIKFFTWVSTKKGADDRRLTLYIDKLPKSHKLVRLQPVTPNGATLLLGNLSDNCVNFAPGAVTQQQGNPPVEAKWENVTFMCDPITNNQTIGTGTAGSGISTILSGSQGRHSYFFFYEDHNARPDDNILISALKSFQVK